MQRISITNPQNIIDGTAKKYYFKLRNTGGPKGDKGDKGDTGATGPQGPQGNAATVSVGSTTTLPVGYDATVTNTGSIYNAVLNFGIPQGPQGPQGAKGDKGDTGAKGDTGPRGPQGERGTNATVYIGTTSTLNPGSQATVYNSGTDSNAVLNFGIPKGEKGDTGATGATGATGPAGQDGQNFTPTIVDSLPATGNQSNLYLTPKNYTTGTATGNPITISLGEDAGQITSAQLDGDTAQYTYNGGNLFDSTIEQGVISSTDGTNTGDTTTNRVRSATQSVAGYGGDITISATTTASGKTLQFVPRYYDANGDYLGYGYLSWQELPTTLTPTPPTTRYIRLLFRLSDNSDITPEQVTNVQITGATSAPNPDYPQAVNTVTGTQTVSINGTDYSIDLGSIELCKLGTYQDYIYKDGENWKVHKWIGKYTYDGTESNWAYSTNVGDGAEVNGVFYRVKPTGADGTNYPNPSVSISDRFISGVRTPTKAGTFIIGSNITFASPSTEIDNATEWTQWLASNNTTVYYKYRDDSVTDTVITDTALIAQLEAVRNATLQASNTITNTATGTNLAGDLELGYYEYDPHNRYNKWLWLDINNNYEQLGS